jgi:hypothetical protein
VGRSPRRGPLEPMTKTLIILLLIPIFSTAQNDTINKWVNGKKDGVWKVYLDSALNRVDHIDSAFFYAFEAYDDGDRIFKHYKDRNKDADSISYSLSWPTKGSPQLLSGIFEWFTNDGRILEHEEYKNGWPWYWKSYHYYAKNPQKCGFNEILDWSKKYNDISGTYYYEELWDNKVHIHGWFRKGKKGWRVYKTK